jgi:hypothetical protein
MPSYLGMSAQGTIIEHSIDPLWPDANPQGGSISFTVVGQLKDITPPPLTRKALETTTHNLSDDQYVMGIRRHGSFTAKINFVPQDPTQNQTTGMQNWWFTGERGIYRLTYPDIITPITGHGTQWLFSGFVENFAPTANVDTVLDATIGIRPTGTHLWVAAV